MFFKLWAELDGDELFCNRKFIYKDVSIFMRQILYRNNMFGQGLLWYMERQISKTWVIFSCKLCIGDCISISLLVASQYMLLRIVCISRWGRVTHNYVSRLTTISSDNGLSPGRRKAIMWTNAGILLTGPMRCRRVNDIRLSRSHRSQNARLG